MHGLYTGTPSVVRAIEQHATQRTIYSDEASIVLILLLLRICRLFFRSCMLAGVFTIGRAAANNRALQSAIIAAITAVTQCGGGRLDPSRSPHATAPSLDRPTAEAAKAAGGLNRNSKGVAAQYISRQI